MFLLVPAHPGFPGQIPQSHKTVVCCVCSGASPHTPTGALPLVPAGDFRFPDHLCPPYLQTLATPLAVNTRKHYFCMRVIEPWNNLNCAVVDFSTLRRFASFSHTVGHIALACASTKSRYGPSRDFSSVEWARALSLNKSATSTERQLGAVWGTVDCVITYDASDRRRRRRRFACMLVQEAS